MPDIAMCKGDGCLVKETCYRHTAKPSMRQSYFITPPFVEKDGVQDCDLYWESKHSRNQKLENENSSGTDN